MGTDIYQLILLADVINGFMSREELSWLMGLASRSNIGIELGSLRGRSSRGLAAAIGEVVICVDRWNGTLMQEFKDNLKYEIDIKKCVPVRGDTQQTATVEAVQAVLAGRLADFVFLDSSHEYEQTLKEIALYKPLIAKGGTLCGHDYHNPKYPGLTKAIDETFGTHKNPVGMLWYVHL